MPDSRRYRIFIHVAAVLVSLVFLGPFLWLFIASIAPQTELLARPLDWIPDNLSLHRYSQIFTARGENVFSTFRSAMVNSAIVAGATVLVSTSVGIFGAYAIARLRFRARRPILLVFLATYMVPPIALVIPMYLVMVKAHLLDTRLGLIVVYCSFATPFVLWIMGNSFQTIPRDLEDAARVDGCSRIGALFRVVLPLARPGLLATIPPVLIATLFQRQIVGGLSGGAVKG